MIVKKLPLALCVLGLAVAGAQSQSPHFVSRRRPDHCTVILRCVFTSEGTVTNIIVVKGLPGGLTEKAIEAARKIKFIPAMKDGKYVSMWMQLEYNFNLY